MKRSIFTQPSEPIELTPRSAEGYKAELSRLAAEEQKAQESLREVLEEVDTKKATKSQLETNILQLHEKERKALKKAGDAKQRCDDLLLAETNLKLDIAELREEKQKLSNEAGTVLEDAKLIADRSKRELDKNVLLKKGLLFVSFYILETLDLARAKLAQAERLLESLLAKLEFVDRLMQKALDLNERLRQELAGAAKDRAQAQKDADEAARLKEQNLAVEEELKLERITINKEKRQIKINA